MGSIIDHIRTATLFAVWIAGLALSGCSDHELPEEPVVPSEPVKALRFTVSNMKVGSRVSQNPDNIYKYKFDEGDKIGCVIAQKMDDGTFEYKANTVWKYRKDGYLILIEEATDNGRHAYESDDDLPVDNSLVDDSYDHNFEFIRRLSDDTEHADADDRNLQLLQTADFNYAFFFYYPYISDKEIAYDYKNHLEYNAIEIPFSKTMYPAFPRWDDYHNFENIQYIYPMAPAGKEQLAHNFSNKQWERHSWRNFAAFVGELQDNERKLSLSDFMWTRYIMDYKENNKHINQETATYEVPLTFRKKFATIQVNSESPLSTVFFQGNECKFSAKNQWYHQGNKYLEGGIRQGKCIDLQTGTMTDYTPLCWDSSWDFNSAIYQFKSSFSNECAIYGVLPSVACVNDRQFMPIVDNSGKTARIILPPQDNFEAKLHFKFTGKETEYVIDLGEKLRKLEENKLYTINLLPIGWDIIIRDWIEDKQGVLIENEPRDPQE